MSGQIEPRQPEDATPESVERRNRMLFIGAWAAFGLGVLVLAMMSLHACDLALLRGLFGRHCEPAILQTTLPSNNLIDEIRSLERDLARSPGCAPVAEAAPPAPPPEPCPDLPPDEVVISVDLSGSMRFCLDTPRARELEIESVQRQANSAYGWQQQQLWNRSTALQEALVCQPSRQRLDYAKQALKELAKSTRSEASFVLQSFSNCNQSARTYGRYSGADRSRMEAQINGMRADGGTNLAAAIASAASQLRGGRTADQPANIVVVSDGQDSCGGNACAAAQQVKRSHPYTKIHVITVGGDVAVGKCIADATGGRVFEARNAAKLADAIQEASGENIPEHCKAR